LGLVGRWRRGGGSAERCKRGGCFKRADEEENWFIKEDV
jgi:hypothetical protein